MKKLTEEDLLGRLKVWRSCAIVYLAELWTKKDDKVYKRIVELIKIFYAKEISSGPIKEDLSRPVLIQWLQGINQAATAVHDDYAMKATTQLIEMITEEKKAKLIWDARCPKIDPTWLPTAENINALPEPVRDYIADMQTNADPPSMVADNIILRDTVKALEKKLEEKPKVTEEWIEEKVNCLYNEAIHFYDSKEKCNDFIRSLVEEIEKK